MINQREIDEAILYIREAMAMLDGAENVTFHIEEALKQALEFLGAKDES